MRFFSDIWCAIHCIHVQHVTSTQVAVSRKASSKLSRASTCSPTRWISSARTAVIDQAEFGLGLAQHMQKSMLLAAGAGRAVRCCPKISVRAHNIDRWRWRCGGRGLHLLYHVASCVCLVCALSVPLLICINITKDVFADG